MAEITQLLQRLNKGDEGAMGPLFDLVYPQLKQLAASQMMTGKDRTITPTVLVNETYLKLMRAQQLDLVDRRHFMVCAAKAMRQIVIDHARASRAQRRGGGQRPVTLTDVGDMSAQPLDWLDLDNALGELEQVDESLKQLVELKFFAGLTMPEIAELLDTSLRTVNRNWVRARAFLHTQLA